MSQPSYNHMRLTNTPSRIKTCTRLHVFPFRKPHLHPIPWLTSPRHLSPTTHPSISHPWSNPAHPRSHHLASYAYLPSRYPSPSNARTMATVCRQRKGRVFFELHRIYTDRTWFSRACGRGFGKFEAKVRSKGILVARSKYPE